MLVARKFKEFEVQVVRSECKRRSSVEMLSLAERIEMHCMLDSKRLRFVDGELRYLRYIHLQPVAQWMEDFKQYKHEVSDWRHQRHANKALHLEHQNKFLKVPMMHLIHHTCQKTRISSTWLR